AHPGFLQKFRMGFEGLDQSAGPAPALMGKLLETIGHVGEHDRVFAVTDAVAMLQEGPGNHDVLAHTVRPPARLEQRLPVVERERALRDQGAVVHALHPLYRGDAVEVVPLLHTRQPVLTGVPGQYRTGYRAGAGRVG